MSESHSDALVFFGATGDLAYSAYELVPGDAMEGDATVFAREDYVEDAWRIVDPVLKAATPVFEYEPKTWAPREVDGRVTPAGGWQNPLVAG
jgi:glucose-6-phosphate 1-dehydrogenase